VNGFSPPNDSFGFVFPFVFILLLLGMLLSLSDPLLPGIPLLLFVPLLSGTILFGVIDGVLEFGSVEFPGSALLSVCAYAPAIPADKKNIRAIIFIHVVV